MFLVNNTPIFLSGTVKPSILRWNDHFYSFKFVGHEQLLVVDSLLNTWSISESFQYHLCNKPSYFVLTCKWFRGTIVDDNKFSCFAYQPKKMSYIFSCAVYSDIMTQRIPCMYSCQYLSLSEMEALLFTSTIKMPACLCCPFSCFLSPLWTPLLLPFASRTICATGVCHPWHFRGAPGSELGSAGPNSTSAPELWDTANMRNSPSADTLKHEAG